MVEAFPAEGSLACTDLYYVVSHDRLDTDPYGHWPPANSDRTLRNDDKMGDN